MNELTLFNDSLSLDSDYIVSGESIESYYLPIRITAVSLKLQSIVLRQIIIQIFSEIFLLEFPHKQQSRQQKNKNVCCRG
jgi:hypothetical protein